MDDCMATIFIKIVNKLGSGDIVLVSKVVKGILKDSMKTSIEGKTVSIKRMGVKSINPGAGPRGASVMQPTMLKEAGEGQILEILVAGIEHQAMAKYAGKNIEFQ